jgi:cytochrome c oxidase subunit 2
MSRCAEFCGLQHTQMRMIVAAEPAERFASWLAGQQRPAVEPAGAVARRGRDVFLTAGCASCHAIRGTTADAGAGPDLTHIASRPTLGAATVPNTPDELARWVTDPHTIKRGVKMPAAELTHEERNAVVTYLGSLR